MHPGGAERRNQRAHHLLGECFPDRLSILVGHAEETVAHSHREFAWPGYLQRQLMKSTPARARIESDAIRAIADQIVTLLILEHALDTAAQIVGIANCDATSFMREIVKTFLRLERDVAPIAQCLFNLRRV